MKLNLRDLFWLILVVAIGLGWWMDHDRIRLQTDALRATAQRLEALPVTLAEKKLQVAEAELAQMNTIRQVSPSALSEAELRLAELRVDAAKVDLEKTRARDEYAD